MPIIYILLVLTFCGIAHIKGQSPASYKIEEIPIPEGLKAETGGLDFFPDGRLAACFSRGEIMIYTPATKKWSLFASGLHEPLGLMIVNNYEIIVMQRPELTRLRDTDKDGEADVFEKITDAFGVSGNYHEFNYGPVKGKDGSLYFALNTASYGAKIQPSPRGPLNPLGRDGETGGKQMYAIVPYRGWVMKLTPEGKLIPYASGLRSPNGIGVDLEGNLFVTDNQGDWVESSTLVHVEEGNFYGHPASLAWKPGWDKGSPFQLPIEELKAMRTPPAVMFPQGIIANSPSQPVWDTTRGTFGPFDGQLLVGEMNRKRIVRVMLEKVNGKFQGACVPFIDDQGLRVGNNRLAFAPDGSLWVGQIAHGWLGSQGLQRITYTGRPPMDILKLSLTRSGFDITFTQTVDRQAASNVLNYTVKAYEYEYKKKPANENVDHATQKDLHEVKVSAIRVSEDGKKVSLSLAELKPGYIYELKLNNLFSGDGQPLANPLVCYTLNSLLK